MASLYRRNNSSVWWVRFQSNGVRIQRSSGTTRRADAMRFLARAMEEERQRQEHGFQKIRLAQLCEEYRRQHLPVLKPRTQAVYEGHIATLKTCFGDRYIDELRKADVASFVARQKASGLKPPTIRRYLATLSSMLTFAARCGWLGQNPMIGFDKRSVPEPPPRSRFLSKQEFRQLHDAAEPHLRPLLVFAVNTGMRLEELLSLKWEQVDLDRREVRLTVTKSNRPRVVPLSDGAVAVLVAISRLGQSRFVFTNAKTGHRFKTIKRSFRTACRRAGLRDVRFHDLRHTFASWAIQSGVDLYRLSRILGHTTLQMTTRYAHLTTSTLHDAVRLMATTVATPASDCEHCSS